MSDDYSMYGMNPDECATYLTEQRQNGFTALSQRDRRFALDFIQSGSYVEASKAAGVSTAVGRRLMRNPLVSAFISYLNQRQEHYSLIDAGFIETQYLSLFAKLIGEDDIPMVDKEGGQFQGKKFDGPAAVSALRDMAKISGHYKEESNLTVEMSAKLTDDQRALLDKLTESKF